MSFSLRIFLGYFLLVAVAFWLFLQDLNEELVPGMRQSLEEVLVDTANLLAETVADEVLEGSVPEGEFASRMEAFGRRRMNAVIWFLKKRDPGLVVYVTDQRGRVLYDSRGRDLGADYSRWNDVYLTLRGEYGARTTRDDPEDEYSSVMYVAAPILAADRIIGVLSVGKPSATVLPFVEAARRSLIHKGLMLLGLSLALGLVLTYGLSASIRQLTRYADQVGRGQRVPAPRLREPEFARLAQAMETMRGELEGKEYVEHYLHTLTHELKSPLTAIQGAAELLDEEMPLETRRRFLGNIRNESLRLRQVVERLLGLAALEKRQDLETVESIDINPLIERLCADKQPLLAQVGLRLTCRLAPAAVVQGETFLIQQALSNLLDNAIEFSPAVAESS